MTLGTVVVEANLTSGALITAGMAIDNGRQLFAVPGRIDSPRSKGCHDLIKKGAKLCEGAEDILSEFEYLFPSSNRPPSPSETGTLPALSLSGSEQKVYEVLSHEEITMDRSHSEERNARLRRFRGAAQPRNEAADQATAGKAFSCEPVAGSSG